MRLYKCISLAALMFVLVACSQHKHNISATIEGLNGDSVKVTAHHINARRALFDTIIPTKGDKFSFDYDYNRALKLTITPLKGIITTNTIRRNFPRKTMSMEIYLFPNENLSIKGIKEGNNLIYSVANSEHNNSNAKIRNQFIKALSYYDFEGEYFRDGKSKEERDSVFNIGKELEKGRENVEIEYIKNNPKSQLSGLYISKLSVSQFDELFDSLDTTVVKGHFKPLIDTKIYYSNLYKNAAKVAVEKSAIDFTVRGIGDKTFTLSENRDRAVLLYFWGSW